MAVLRIEILEFIYRSSCKVAHLSQMQHLIDPEGIDMSRHLDGRRLDSMLLVVVHGVEGTYECRNITSCLTRKIRVDIPELPLSAASSDSPVHIAGAAVVRGDGKVPVAEDLI